MRQKRCISGVYRITKPIVVEFARVSDCIIRNDRKNAGDWRPIEIVGGKANMIVDNLLGKPASGEAVKTDTSSTIVRGNLVAPQ